MRGRRIRRSQVRQDKGEQGWACVCGGEAWICPCAVFHVSVSVVAIKLRILALMALSGADPHTPLQGDMCALTYAASEYMSSSPPLEQLLTLFHPMARGVTCIHTLDLTQRVDAQHTLFQQLQHYSTHTYTQATATRLLTALSDIITRINMQQRQRQLDGTRTFILATHPRVGAASAVHRVLCASPLYDACLLRVIWRYVYIAEMLPCNQEEVDELERARTSGAVQCPQ